MLKGIGTVIWGEVPLAPLLSAGLGGRPPTPPDTLCSVFIGTIFSLILSIFRFLQ